VSEWQDTKLGNLGKVVTGKTPSKDNPEDWGSEVLFVTPSDYKNYGKYANSSIRMLSNVGTKRQANRLLPTGSVLVTCIGSDMGKTAINSEPCVTNQQINAIIPNSQTANSDFIYYLTKDLYETLSSLGSDGTAVPILNKSDFENIDVSIPRLEEQKAIASVLSSLDDKIDLLHRQNTTLERMAETLFRQWFVEEAQEDWEELTLDKLVNITSSKRIFYSEYVTSGVPFYRSKEIIELHNSGSTNSELFITEARFNEISDKFGAPQENDILLTSVGTLGVPYKVKKSDRFYFKDGNLTWFKDFVGMPSVIIYCWLKSNIGKEQLDSITIGSTQAALTISGLKQIIFKVPPKEIIKLAEEKLNAIYNKVDGNQIQIQTLEKLRDNLLPKLMSGEIRMQNG
jgi:type I restriction enzyme, S subunit